MKRISLLALMALFLAALVACAGGDTTAPRPRNVVVISGNIQGSATPTVPDAIVNLIIQDLMGGGEIMVIAPDERPSLTRIDPIIRGSGVLTEAWRDFLNRKFLQGDANTAPLVEQINSIAPRRPGYNLSEALSLAARQDPDHIIILGHMLSTHGAVNFTEGDLLLADDEQRQAFAENLFDTNRIPDLRGARVTVVGLGEVNGDQPALDNHFHVALEDLWREIIEFAGGSVEFRPGNINADFNPELPAVPLVSLPVRADAPPPIVIEPPRQTIVLNDAALNFVMDQAVFIDPVGAERFLDTVAVGLIQSGQQVYILGMTALAGDGSNPILNQLSLQRAQAFRDVLVTIGVPSSQISVVGTGSLPNAFRQQPDTVGSVVNRVAIIVDAEDSRIQQILSGQRGVDFYVETD
ncbi:hypothetical protein FWC63_02260 [Candidatus Saccharibacteria bacterium]|nr:hypothetical protein [Candidatus Saccharibacteria bacterium]